MISGLLLSALTLMLTACGTKPALRPASPDDLATLRALAADPAHDGGFRATGRARVRNADEEIEGAIEVRVAPPAKAWLQVRTRALFGMVGERVVASMPGDGWVLVYEERADALSRVPFDSSLVAGLGPEPGPEALLALLRGRLPASLASGTGWDAVQVTPDGASRSVLVERRGSSPGQVRLELDGPSRLRRFVWESGGEPRLDIRYDRWQPCGASEVPTQVRLRAPKARLEADLDLDEVVPQQGFTPADFEVGSNRLPSGAGTPTRDEV